MGGDPDVTVWIKMGTKAVVGEMETGRTGDVLEVGQEGQVTNTCVWEAWSQECLVGLS